jgi:hypothetical protein
MFVNTFIELPMDDDEIDFVNQRYQHASKEYMYGMNIMLVGAVGLAFLVALFNYLHDPNFEETLIIYGYAQSITAVIALIIVIANYLLSLYDLNVDLKRKLKIAEQVTITEKKYMESNNSYHFYISSEVKYSIEVPEDSFNYFQINDEITIEYTKYAALYLGYY